MGRLLVLLAVLLVGAAPELKGPAETPDHKFVRLELTGEYGVGLWDVEPEDLADVEVSDDGRHMMFVGPPGAYRVRATWIDFDSRKAGHVKGTFTITGTAPVPVPVPPGPIPPGPVPPGPTPPTPVPGTGFRVLIVAETSANYTRAQLNVLNSTAVVEYLNRKAQKDPDGRAGWRRWDPQVELSARETDLWRALWAAVKPTLGQLPAVAVVQGQKVDLYPLPETEQALLALLARYGGS